MKDKSLRDEEEILQRPEVQRITYHHSSEPGVDQHQGEHYEGGQEDTENGQAQVEAEIDVLLPECEGSPAGVVRQTPVRERVADLTYGLEWKKKVMRTCDFVVIPM